MTNKLLDDLFSYQYSEIVFGIILIILMIAIWKYILKRPLLPPFPFPTLIPFLMLLPDDSFPDGKTFYKYFENEIAPMSSSGEAKILTGELGKTTCDIAKTYLERNCAVSLITGHSLKEDRLTEAQNFIRNYKDKIKMFVSESRENNHFILFDNYLYVQYPHAHGTTGNCGWGKKIGKYSLHKFIYNNRFNNIKKVEIKSINDLNNRITINN